MNNAPLICRNTVACLALLVPPAATPGVAEDAPPTTDVLTDKQWDDVDRSLERALAFLASNQRDDGSFRTTDNGQPGVTGLCVLAFLANGHTPGQGPYGEGLDQAVKFIVSCQKQNGLLSVRAPEGPKIRRNVSRQVGAVATYNHGIAGLALSEVYASTDPSSSQTIKAAIEKAIEATLVMQQFPKVRPEDHGGWRYLDILITQGERVDSNLSNTSWQMLFLRSAKNAGFDVQQQTIDDAVGFINRCFHPGYRTFVLMPSHRDHRTRGMAGAGVMALALAGRHESPAAQTAGDWILEQSFAKYNRIEPFGQRGWYDDRYHYGIFYCTQATYQLGGRHWQQFFPHVVDVVLENQRSDGSWEAESHTDDTEYGRVYTTALMALSLSAPNQLLPVLQR